MQPEPMEDTLLTLEWVDMEGTESVDTAATEALEAMGQGMEAWVWAAWEDTELAGTA